MQQTHTRDKKLIQYVLRRILKHHHPATGLDDLTLEHLLSQDKIGKGETAETIGSIGNLLLINEKLNGKLDNKDFATKVGILAKDGKPYDIGGVLDNATWSKAEIDARTELLAEVAYDAVWKLPC